MTETDEIMNFPQNGIKIWGQRTLQRASRKELLESIYIRLMDHLEKYGFKSIQCVDFSVLEEVASAYPDFAKKLAEPIEEESWPV